MAMTKHILIATALVLALAVACDRYLDSRDPVRPMPDEIPIPVNLAARLDDGSVTVSWELTNAGKVVRFRVYTADGEAGVYTLEDSTTDHSLTMDDLPLDQRLYFRVASVTSSGIESTPSESVTAVPIHLSMVINGDNEYTNSQTVQVQLSTGITPSYVKLSEQTDFADAEWESYAFTKSFELSEGDGVKTVYVRMQYPDGAETGEPLSDSIILDTHAEITDLISYAMGTLRVGDENTFRVTAGETGGQAWVSFGSVRNFALNDDGTEGDITADDGIYARTYTVPSGLSVLKAVVYADFTDAAGNRAETYSDPEITIDINMPPAAVTLAADTTDSTLVLTWSLSTETDFASYRLYRGSSPSETPGTDPMAIITDVAVTRYETTIPVGSPYFWLFVFDSHDEWARSSPVQRP